MEGRILGYFDTGESSTAMHQRRTFIELGDAPPEAAATSPTTNSNAPHRRSTDASPTLNLKSPMTNLQAAYTVLTPYGTAPPQRSTRKGAFDLCLASRLRESSYSKRAISAVNASRISGQW